MNIFCIVLLAITLMVVLLRRKIALGPSILTAGLFIWFSADGHPEHLWDAFTSALQAPRTYDLLLALYFVVCLEIELRKSGALKGMVDYLYHLIPSKKFALALMPSFLGLLPSVGGARFSAPIVEEIAQGVTLTGETKAGINYWFRHIMEFSNPIVPGMILTSSIAHIAPGTLIVHLLWVTIAMAIIGWFTFLTPMNIPSEARLQAKDIDLNKCKTDFILCLVPVLLIFFLCIYFGMKASISILIAVIVLYPILLLAHRKVALKDIIIGAFEKKLFRDVGMIIYFISLLELSGALTQIAQAMHTLPLPIPVVIAFVSFVIGMLTGLSQGHVPIMMPLVAAIAPTGNLDLVGIALVFGVGGQMVTPTHVCLIVSLDYFKADFFKTLKPCVIAEVALLALFSAYTYFTYSV